MKHRTIHRHCEERSDAAIQNHKLGKNWIASSQGLLAKGSSQCRPEPTPMASGYATITANKPACANLSSRLSG